MVQDQAADVASAVQDWSVTETINRLRRSGFGYEKQTDGCTGRTVVVFVRVWRGVRDAVVAMSYDEAIAYRVWDEDFDGGDPTMVEPDIALWVQRGPFVTVAAAVLALSAPAAHSHFPSAAQKADVGGAGR
jgi:hypothetical protein